MNELKGLAFPDARRAQGQAHGTCAAGSKPVQGSHGPSPALQLQAEPPPGAGAPAGSAPGPTLPPQARGRVLVVDDNVDAVELLAALLEAFGYKVRIAYDGLTALRLAAEFDPDVVICDIGLPDIDGYEVARRLRGEETGRRRHMVALSGYGQPSDKARSRVAGFDVHLVKPADILQLRKMLDEMTAPRS